LANESLGKAVFGIFIAVDEIVAAERAPDRFERGRPGPFVHRDANAVAPDLAQVDAVIHRILHDQPLIGADIDRNRIEEGIGMDVKAQR
jgi:hypothetical protein